MPLTVVRITTLMNADAERPAPSATSNSIRLRVLRSAIEALLQRCCTAVASSRGNCRSPAVNCEAFFSTASSGSLSVPLVTLLAYVVAEAVECALDLGERVLGSGALCLSGGAALGCMADVVADLIERTPAPAPRCA